MLAWTLWLYIAARYARRSEYEHAEL